MTRNSVVPRYVPANAVEDKLGFLLTALTLEDKRVYLSRIGKWSGIGEALFFFDPVDAADSLKAAKEANMEELGIKEDSILLVRCHGFLIPTEISEADLKRKRRESGMKKLTQDEIEALGLTPKEDDRASFAKTPR